MAIAVEDEIRASSSFLEQQELLHARGGTVDIASMRAGMVASLNTMIQNLGRLRAERAASMIAAVNATVFTNEEKGILADAISSRLLGSFGYWPHN